MSTDLDKRNEAIIAQQNLLRGVFAGLEKKVVESDQTITNTLTFRNGRRRAFLQARASLDVDDYPTYLDWYHEQLFSRFPRTAKEPIGFDYLNGLFSASPISLRKELRWISSVLIREQHSLNNFRRMAQSVETCAASGDKRAFGFLKQLTDSCGESMWSVQLRIALEQQFNGLEAQKRYLDQIRSIYRRGILSFVAYHTSVRNEDRTSIARFREDLTAKIDARPPKETQSYLKYRLLGEWPATVHQVADILRVEQSHSIYDIYETVISLGQECIRRSDLAHIKAIFAETIGPLNVDDFRLIKLKAVHCDPSHLLALPCRSLEMGDVIASGNVDIVAYRNSRRSKSDPWSLIYSAALMSRRKKKVPNTAAKPLDFSARLLKTFRRSLTSDQDIFELEKLCFNLSAFSISKAILDFLGQLRSSPTEPPLRFYLSSLNCASIGPEDFGLCLECNDLLNDLYSSDLHRPAVQVWRSRTHSSDTPSLRSVSLTTLAAATREYDVNNLDGAIDLLVPLLAENEPDIIRNLAAALLIRSQISTGNRPEIIRSIANEGALNPSRSVLLPIHEALHNLEYADYRPLGAELAPLIALDLLWKETDDDRTASILRFATSQFLRINNKTLRPSDLAERSSSFEPHQLVYFLRYICVPGIIDVSRVLKSSREVLEERQAICGVLNSLDPSNSEEYQAEIFTIAHKLKVTEGLQIVDRNRIHVDTDAITRWAKRTIVEEFARYKDLIRANIGIADSFDEVLREALAQAKFPKQMFFTPESEADAVLLDLLVRLKEEFLNNSTHGLDYYLSKRIRHQSFVGLVRGPLEFNNIITTRTTEHGDYRPNQFWLEKLTTLEKESLAEIDTLFRTFSENFDRSVRQVKDDLFHVRSADQPLGIFDFEISSSLLLIARAVAVHDVTLEDFLKTAYALFWGSLDTALTRARHVIENNLKMSASNGVDVLRAGIRQYAERDPGFLDLGISLSKASTEVQIALSEAETWFNRPEIEQAARMFTSEEALDVAIESAMKAHRAFEPKITKTIDGDIDLAASDLVFITDAVFISFSNIKSYSGLLDPPIHIELVVDRSRGVLSIEICNEYLPRTRTIESERRLQEIRDLIADGAATKRVRKEGGTGFLKLSAVVSQSERGRLEFGYTEANTFRFLVEFSLIVSTNDDAVLVEKSMAS